MQLNIIDDKTHRVADDLHYEVTRLENHPIITIDNVLENPHDFLENVVQKAPMQFNSMDINDEVFPGYQTKLRLNLPELTYLTAHFIKKCTDFTEIDPNVIRMGYQVNAMVSDVQVPRISIQPHVDPAIFATVLYLNPENTLGGNAPGGTAFFRHKATGLTNMENVYTGFRRTEQYWNLKEWIYDFSDKSNEMVDNDISLIEDVWEEEHFVPMQFNRMIIYPSYMWHTAVCRSGWYKDNPRVSLSGFVHADTLNVDIDHR
tara:strand:- start:44 stop:823 length:780 start_codon:yes stop_codon:yes gene_type:complete